MSDVPGDYIERAKAFAAIAAGTKPPKISAIQLGFDLARIDSYSRLPGLREELRAIASGKQRYRFHTEIYGQLIYLTVFELQWGEIRTFEGFSALMVELLGDDIRPFLVSLYLAGLHHPSLEGLEFDWPEALALLGRPERGGSESLSDSSAAIWPVFCSAVDSSPAPGNDAGRPNPDIVPRHRLLDRLR